VRYMCLFQIVDLTSDVVKFVGSLSFSVAREAEGFC